MTYENHEDLLMDTVLTLETVLAGPDENDGALAAVTVPAPRRPGPHDSAIALPEPDEDDRD